jgi:hypothetical protein
MRSVRYILLSYFQHHFMVNVLLVMAILGFFAGQINSLRPAETYGFDDKGWAMLFLSLIVISAVMGGHLKRMLRSNTCELWPLYRRRQLQTAGLLLIVFGLWPLVLSLLRGYPVGPMLVIFLFSVTLVLGLIFRWDENVVVFIILFWGVRLVYEVMGMPVERSFFPAITAWVQSLPPWPLALGLSLACLTALVYYGRYYLRVSPHDLFANGTDTTDPYTREHDRVGPVTERIIRWRLYAWLRRSRGQNHRRGFLRGMYQLGMFSPVNVLEGYLVIGILMFGYLYTLRLLMYGPLDRLSNDAGPALACLGHIFVCMLSVDFLQHRDRLEGLWLRSALPSRRQFMSAVAAAYMMVNIRNTLLFCMACVPLPLIASFLTYTDVLRLFGLNILAAILCQAATLAFSHQILSADARGWVVASVLLSILAMVMYGQVWRQLNGTVFLVSAAVCLMLLALAWRRWEGSELAFRSVAPTEV